MESIQKRAMQWIVMILAGLAISQRSFASSDEGKVVAIYVDPLSLLLGGLLGGLDVMGGIDIAALPFLSIGATGEYTSIQAISLTGSSTSITGWALGPRLNFFFAGNRISDSWYFAPFGEYSQLNVTSGASSQTFSVSEVAALIGKQWVWNSGFNMRLGVGGTYWIGAPSAVTVAGTTVSLASYNGLHFAAEWTIGWAF